MSPTTTPQPETSLDLAVPADRLPRHVAIIMDGNGRWAEARGRGRTYGHRKGAEAVRDVVTESARLGLQALTLYSFSTENWSRSPEEVECLMELYVEYLIKERSTMVDNNIRFRQIGQREGLPPAVLNELDQTTALTGGCTGMHLVLAINYGSRAEITDAVRSIARQARAGEIDPAAIDEQTISDHLYTAGLPDPDLLIRTAGERRLSNYLLWQISYAEIHVSEVCWPDFKVPQFHDALRDFASRQRRFGGVM